MDSNELTKIYVCSPYRKMYDTTTAENVAATIKYCKFVKASAAGCVPIAPHIYLTQFMNDHDPDERARALELGRCLLAECKEIWVFGSFVSDGMAAEISEASRLKIPIRWFTNTCVERVTKPQEVNDDV